MAVRQPSAATGKPKKPRVQSCISEALLEKLEAYAEQQGWSVSRAIEEILREKLEGAGQITGTTPAATGSNDGDMMKTFKMIRQMKEAGLL